MAPYRISRLALALGAFALIAGIARGQGDALQQGFQNLPADARPRVWWHWTGGNVTKAGITKDLEWMKSVGIAGAQMADIGRAGGQNIDHPIEFFTPEWFDTVRYAASEADRLGLEMSIFSCSGWSESGGPWVKPAEAMKKLVWSETDLEGPMKFSGKLPQPPSGNGTFGSLRGSPQTAVRPPAAAIAATGTSPVQTFYGDSAVIAFRTPADEQTMQELNPKVTSNTGAINGAALMDDDLGTVVSFPAGADGTAWVQYEFAQPITARAVTLIAQGRGIPFGQIQTSDDGTNFKSLVELPGPVQYRAGPLKTYAFPETSAKFFRVLMTGSAPNPDAVIYQTAPAEANHYSLSEFIVHTGARVDRWEEKAAFNFVYEYQTAPTPQLPDASVISSTDVIDITSKMDAEGNLTWDVPAGKWTVMRMGYSLTGAKNRVASASGSGLEVDKLNAKDVEDYFHGYWDPIVKNVGPLVGKSLRYQTMDSWEAGSQNWTDDMIAQFTKLRGYDPTPYLPVLAGRVVGSADISDRFLWDFRRTIADLLAEAHYGTMDRLVKSLGMSGIYAEAEGVSMEIIEDTLLNKSKVDVPMGEFWLGKMHPAPEYYVDNRMAASAAHIYGKRFVGAESFTGGGYDSPATYKDLADYWFAQGLNRIMFHSSAQQPLDTKPGNTMVGTHFNRNITWADQAEPLVTYFSRCQYMLSQGLYVADFAYLLNEGAPSSQPFWGAGLQPAVPDGYDYDTVNADVLLNRMSVGPDGRIMLPDGMSYRVLVLPQIDRMRPELLRKIKELVLGGTTVVGPRPTMSPSLQGGPDADREVKQLADEIWGDLDGVQRNKHYLGKGLVTWGLPLPDVAALIKTPKDAEFAAPLDANLVWIHRRTPDADIYYVANLTGRAQDIDGRFRVDGKEPELWHPDTGKVDPSSYNIADGRTTVPLHLDEHETVFVVFQKTATSPSRSLAPPATTTPLNTIDGPWTLAFQPKLGAPAKINLAKLDSWTDNADAGVKYFSGTGTYTKTLQAPKTWFAKGARLLLDLGNVGDIAQVSLNGKPLGTLWKPPYQVDVTNALKPGKNELEIKVTNEWNNRIAGDALLPANQRILSPGVGRGGYGPGPIAAPSGLMGPVTFLSQRSEQAADQ
jgi:hypothetical protein